MSNLSLAQSFAPTYAALPSYLKRSTVAISPRFPRTGVNAATPASGTTGLAGTITPERSAVEAAAWGATVALWVYVTDAVAYGYASVAQFTGEFAAAGILLQGSGNTRAVNPSTGPFMQDAGGSNWSAGSEPDRPALVSGTQSPLKSRVYLTVDYMPAADQAGSKDPKVADAAAQIAAGCFGLHMDDTRGAAAYCGWAGITNIRDQTSAFVYDLIGQGGEFSATARAGFTTWLGVNTTSAERIAVGLPSSLSGFDILTWLKANKASIMTAGVAQVDSAAVDNYLYRTGVSGDESLRTIILNWMGRFLREDHADYLRQVKVALGGGPYSINFYSAIPSEYMSWHCRQTPQIFDFAVAETVPPYWSDLSSYTVGSLDYFNARAQQQALQKLYGATCDMVGLRAYFENKPTALNTAPARVVVQTLRQCILQNMMDGHTPVVPIDVFMTTSGAKSQGVNVDGYRFWGSRADYKTCFDFLAASASLIDDYEKLTNVFLAVHNDSFPFIEGSQEPRFTLLTSRLAELWKRDVDYHLLPVGAGLLPTDLNRTVELNAPIIIRLQDDADYYQFLGRLSNPRCRRWSTRAADEAMGHSPVRSTNAYVRATARHNAAAGRVSVHLQNFAVNSDGTPLAQTTTLLWNWGGAGLATVTRLGEADTTVDLSSGSAAVSLTEYAIVNFAVVP